MNQSLREFEFLKDLTNEEMDYLSENVIYRELDNKSVLYREGCKVDSLIFIFDGIVKQVKCGSKGKELVIRFAKAGEIIGFRSMMTDELACTTTETMSPLRAGFIKRDCLLEIIHSNTSFALNIIRQACLELEETQKFIVNVAQKQIRERVAEVLIQLKNVFGVDEDNVLKTSITRKEIASAVGTVPESVIRMLSEFRDDKLIELNGKKIKLLDIPRLTRMSYSSVYAI